MADHRSHQYHLLCGTGHGFRWFAGDEVCGRISLADRTPSWAFLEAFHSQTDLENTESVFPFDGLYFLPVLASE